MFIVRGLYSRMKILPLHPSASPICAIRRIEKLANCQTSRWVPLGWSRWGATKHQHCNSEYASGHDIYTPEECADEWMPLNAADFKWLWHEWFHHVRRHVPDGHSIAEILTTIIWRLNSFTVYFRGGVRLKELASVDRITWLRNRNVSDLKIMAKWRDIIFDVLIWWNPMIQMELHNLK